METIVVAAWLVVAVVLLVPPLLGVHRTTWPLKSYRFPDADRDVDSGASPGRVPASVGQCRACGEDGQAGFTYCRVCLTPLPQIEEGADTGSKDGHLAD